MGDSTNPTYYQYYDNGKFVKQSNYSSYNTTDDDVTRQAAAFRNGNKGWVKYLTNNLITPDRLKNTLGRGKYVITVCFLIDTRQGS